VCSSDLHLKGKRRIQLTQSPEKIKLQIAAPGFGPLQLLPHVSFLVIALVIFWLRLPPIFSWPWLLLFIWQAARIFRSSSLEIDYKKFCLKNTGLWYQEYQGETGDIEQITLNSNPATQPLGDLTLEEIRGIFLKRHCFGTQLNEEERVWLVWELRRWLTQIKG